ncbi:hypothetical protein CLOP_g16868 [Closterium sp. NIES-67]|nr:hypothetical protein CLOP_g16868 [Closterium sp. NIES-67]
MATTGLHSRSRVTLRVVLFAAFLSSLVSLATAIRLSPAPAPSPTPQPNSVPLIEQPLPESVNPADPQSVIDGLLTDPRLSRLPPGLHVPKRDTRPLVTDPAYVDSIVAAEEEPVEDFIAEEEGGAGGAQGRVTPSEVTPKGTPVYVHSSQIAPMMELKSVWGKTADLSTWVASNPCATWRLVNCWTNGFIRRMEMSYQELFATLPSAIGALTQLEEFFAVHNWIYGDIPESFSNLVNLKNLQLYQNFLNGTIPASMGRMTSLYQLHLNLNYLTGSIPDTFSNLKNMQKFYVPSNLLSGPFPTVVCTMTSLRQLRLSYNRFTGPVAGCLSMLKNLNYMYIDTNKFSGVLPSSIGTIMPLTNLFINQNSFIGPLPIALTRLTNLNILFMSSNPYLDGPLPANVGSMKSLTDLVAEFVPFNGTIPASISKLTKLSRILLDNNQFTGTIPNGISRLKELTVLYLEENELYGTFPRGIMSLPKLSLLNLHNNMLSGPLPTGFRNGTLLSAGQYNLHSNYFYGPASVTAGGVTACPQDQTRRGVFFQSSIASNCLTYPNTSACYKAGRVDKQVGASTCLRFCNAGVNPCGGHGACWFTAGVAPNCLCDKGYVPTEDKQSCIKKARGKSNPPSTKPRTCGPLGLICN